MRLVHVRKFGVLTKIVQKAFYHLHDSTFRTYRELRPTSFYDYLASIGVSILHGSGVCLLFEQLGMMPANGNVIQRDFLATTMKTSKASSIHASRITNAALVPMERSGRSARLRAGLLNG